MQTKLPTTCPHDVNNVNPINIPNLENNPINLSIIIAAMNGAIEEDYEGSHTIF